MSTHTPLMPTSPWVQIAATADDYRQADAELLTTMLGQLVLIRAFEEYVLELAGQGLVNGPRIRASARKAVRSARCSRSRAPTRSTDPIVATTSSSPRRCTM